MMPPEMPELGTWTCGQCQRTIFLPSEQTEYDAYLDTILRIREHRLGHLIVALESASDEELLRQCEDVNADDNRSGYAYLQSMGTPPRVDPEDVSPVLAGITELLQADLPRARRLWYPVNEDGSFNR